MSSDPTWEAPNENARSLIPASGERYSSHPSKSRVCDRDCGGEVPRVLLLSFREGNSENPSVRSMTSSVGVAADGDFDLEGSTLRLGVFSSSSEEITCTIRAFR